MTELKIDWATHAAASYACRHWHYSKKVPAGKLLKVGVWEHDKFIGVVLFGRGANHNLPKLFSLGPTECVELVRIALTAHENPVTRIVSIALRFLRRSNPGVKVVVSYADPMQGHHGGIYQAGNWIYTGKGQGSREWFIGGQWLHNRIAGSTGPSMGRNKDIPTRVVLGKHRYVIPLDAAMRTRIMKLSEPYPKRVTRANSEYPSESGGSIPTGTLHTETKRAKAS